MVFLEIYAIPLSDYTKDASVSARPENRRLIEMTGARIRTSTEYSDRAEIVMPNKEVLLAVGSYDQLLERLAKAQQVVIARA